MTVQGDHIYDWYDHQLLMHRIDLIPVVIGFILLAWLISDGAAIAGREYRRYRCWSREPFRRIGHRRHREKPRPLNGLRSGLIKIDNFLHRVT